MWTRREAVGTGMLALSSRMWAAEDGVHEQLRALEARSSGRLGVWMLETGSGRTAGYKEAERFAMCSTFKALLAGAVLHRVDAGQERLGRELAVPAAGLVNYSPVTQAHAGGMLTVDALCAAAVERSDNEASNLLLTTVGGPAGVTAFCRSLGDRVTRLDRTEPTLNEAKPGDPRDTTTPAQIVATWRKMVLGDALQPESRERLAGWLVNCQTGTERLRKGFGEQRGWRVGDKTGSADTTCNDIAVVWRDGRAPVLVAAFLTECPGTDAKRNGVIAEVGRIAAAWMG